MLLRVCGIVGVDWCVVLIGSVRGHGSLLVNDTAPAGVYTHSVHGARPGGGQEGRVRPWRAMVKGVDTVHTTVMDPQRRIVEEKIGREGRGEEGKVEDRTGEVMERVTAGCLGVCSQGCVCVCLHGWR